MPLLRPGPGNHTVSRVLVAFGLRVDREAEDWSFLKDPANRTELWDPLKYITHHAGLFAGLGY
jgi:hypothetical protein